MNIELANLRNEVNHYLGQMVEANCQELSEIDNQLAAVADSLREYLAEGKRFRPLFALIGFLGAGGTLSPAIFRAAASLEFLQASALIHDDLMDGSDTRRGKPSIHKRFEVKYDRNFGAAAAILIGDLALVWNEQGLHRSGIDHLAQLAVNPIHDVMRTELMSGQFLDVFEQTQKSFSIERSLKIARFKSGKYSIERPLHFGAALALPKDFIEYQSICSEYGLPLGEAFQLRDDLLGVFGDPSETGKPAGDDLREGKRTALIAFAYDRGDATTKTMLTEKLGKDLTDQEVEQLKDAIFQSGALKHTEELIDRLAATALAAIERDEIASDAKPLLNQMVQLVTKRTR